MDDNKVLTLINGERIRLEENCSLVFEVENLKFASPATVSRCGMVFFENRNLKGVSIWKSWLKKRFDESSEETSLFMSLYDRYVEKLIDLIFEGRTETANRPKMKLFVHRLRIFFSEKLFIRIFRFFPETKLIFLFNWRNFSNFSWSKKKNIFSDSTKKFSTKFSFNRWFFLSARRSTKTIGSFSICR